VSVRIAPSILAADFTQLGNELSKIESAGADWVHVDVMDGHFVPNITIGPFIVDAVNRSTNLPLDVHLMIEQPERYIDDFIKMGADTIGVHVETCPHLHSTLADIRAEKVRACAVLNPGTPASMVEPVLGDLDQVLVMTVNPGFGGQSFIASQLEKIAILRRWIDDAKLDVTLEVDGGVKKGTIELAAAAGADTFVAGTAVFGTQDYGVAIRELRTLAEKAQSARP
jgi:ribulose-phosphate 3-epimerase